MADITSRLRVEIDSGQTARRGREPKQTGACWPSGTLFTGFFWEMWNYYSLPKWVYHVPYVGFWKIFEMPALGYLGYPFFGLIVFTWTSIVLAGLVHWDLIAIFGGGERQKVSNFARA